jgi:hypothetical protein
LKDKNELALNSKNKIKDQYRAARAADKTTQIHKFYNYIWNKEELPDRLKESIIVPIYKKGDKTDYSKNLLNV